MGSEDGQNDEKPVHNVTLDNFYIGRYEVTQGEYLKFCYATDSNYPAWLEPGNKYNINSGSENDYKKLAGPGKNDFPVILGRCRRGSRLI